MRIGILGGGQLGRMLALAGYPLGHRFRVLDPSPEACAGRLAELVVGAYDDERALERFARGLDVATYEFENVPAVAADTLAARLPLRPAPRALEIAQDRLLEKMEFRRLGIPTTEFARVDTYSELEDAVTSFGYPAVLKTRRLGYDGKGQRVLHGPEDIAAAWRSLGGYGGGNGGGLLLEVHVAFDRELSIVAARSADGEMAFYPLVENEHEAGILRITRAPAPGVSAALQERAEGYARRLFESLGYVGVGAIELFEREGELFANEFAPRVHNSGHWTLDGAETSQFENHIRAITGMPLGSTAPVGVSTMINLIGALPDPGAVLAIPHAHLHLYDKAPAPGRKVGHVTVRGDDREAVDYAARRVQALLPRRR